VPVSPAFLAEDHLGGAKDLNVPVQREQAGFPPQPIDRGLVLHRKHHDAPGFSSQNLRPVSLPLAEAQLKAIFQQGQGLPFYAPRLYVLLDPGANRKQEGHVPTMLREEESCIGSAVVEPLGIDPADLLNDFPQVLGIGSGLLGPKELPLDG
jgi:hypothetical protein